MKAGGRPQGATARSRCGAPSACGFKSAAGLPRLMTDTATPPTPTWCLECAGLDPSLQSAAFEVVWGTGDPSPSPFFCPARGHDVTEPVRAMERDRPGLVARQVRARRIKMP
jgi:hypothetical protein